MKPLAAPSCPQHARLTEESCAVRAPSDLDAGPVGAPRGAPWAAVSRARRVTCLLAAKRLKEELHLTTDCAAYIPCGPVSQCSSLPRQLAHLALCAGSLAAYQWTWASGLAVAVSSLLGLAVSLSTFLVIGAVGSLAYNVRALLSLPLTHNAERA